MRKRNYINNKTLYEHMTVYYDRVQEAKRMGTEPPRVPDYVGECILLISSHLANKGNFSGYSYIDEMKSDGIENALLYIDNFDPKKSKNPFAYFTQIIKFAFIRRIEKERKQHYVKLKNLHNSMLMDEIEKINDVKINLNEITDEFINDFENKMKLKKRENKCVKSNNLIEFN